MRKTETAWDVLMSSQIMSARIWLRAARLAAVAAGIGFVVTSGVARAQDDDNDETFEEKIIHNIMTGIGATNMESKGIDYRERSPLVIPPKIDLPPPGSASAEINNVPNWPKDPDLQRRKQEAAANRRRKPEPWESGQTILPSKLAQGGAAMRKEARNAQPSDQPGKPVGNENPSLSPSQLGFTGKLSNLFGGSGTETAKFTSEPNRERLTEPPPGYQTPSSDYAYGAGGPQKPIGNTFIDVNSGKEVTY